MWEIVHGVLVFAVIWWIIFKVSDAIQNLPWLERRRLQKAFDAANNWKPPKRTPEMTPATYRVVYSDGVCGPRTFVPMEIEGWAVRHNNNTEGKTSHRILRILDARGNIVWPTSAVSAKSEPSWKEMSSLASQMVSSDAQRMLAMKTQQVMSNEPQMNSSKKPSISTSTETDLQKLSTAPTPTSPADPNWHSDWARDDRDSEKIIKTLEKLIKGREANSRPKSQHGSFLMTPQQHEERAKQLRESKSPKAQELALQHENLAKLIRKRSAS